MPKYFLVAISSTAFLFSEGSQTTIKPPDEVFFSRGPAPFLEDGYKTYLGIVVDDKGRTKFSGHLSYHQLYSKFHSSVSVAYAFEHHSIVALSGAAYTVWLGEVETRLKRIPDKSLPKGVKPIQRDSFTIPLQREFSTWANIRTTQVVVREITPAHNKNTHAVATLSSVVDKALAYATVKEGDYVLLADRCFLVRGVVPYDKETRVAGWVEFAPQPIPEADLIRDKKAYIKPMPKAQKK